MLIEPRKQPPCGNHKSAIVHSLCGWSGPPGPRDCPYAGAMDAFFLTTTVTVTIRLADDGIPSDAVLRELVREMITSGVEEHFGTVEELAISKLEASASIDTSPQR